MKDSSTRDLKTEPGNFLRRDDYNINILHQEIKVIQMLKTIPSFMQFQYRKITEWLRLEGTSGSDLVQLPVQAGLRGGGCSELRPLSF